MLILYIINSSSIFSSYYYLLFIYSFIYTSYMYFHIFLSIPNVLIFVFHLRCLGKKINKSKLLLKDFFLLLLEIGGMRIEKHIDADDVISSESFYPINRLEHISSSNTLSDTSPTTRSGKTGGEGQSTPSLFCTNFLFKFFVLVGIIYW